MDFDEDYRNLRFLIVGGSGFVGCNLARELHALNCDVCIFDVMNIPYEYLDFARFRKGDVKDKNDLRDVIFEFAPDVIIHLASWGMSGAAMLNPLCQRINVQGVQALIEVCIECSISKLIYTSSYNVIFGGQEIKYGDESMDYYPIDEHTDYYSKSKAQAEQLVLNANGRKLGNDNHLSTLIIRPAAIYGEGERRHFPRIIKLMDNGLFRFTVGNAMVDWVHIDNLTQAFILASDKLVSVDDPKKIPSGRAYFISDDSPIHSWEFLRPLAEANDCEFPTICIPVYVMKYFACLCEFFHVLFRSFGLYFEPFCTQAEVFKVGITHHFSVERAKHELGYHPRVDSIEGAKRVAFYYSKKVHNSNYFRTPSILLMTLIIFGMSLLFAVAFEKRFSPADNLLNVYIINNGLKLGLLIFRSISALQTLFYLATGIHIVEAFISLYLTSYHRYTNTRILWFVSTLLFGYPSLRLIHQRNNYVKKNFDINHNVI